MSKTRIAITGGASGLGKALALHYAARGARIALLDLSDERGAETLAEVIKRGGEGFYLHGDVREDASFERLRAEVEARWGGLDIFFNNAGVAAHGAFDHAPLADWQWIVEINLLSVVRAVRAFTPLFKRQRSGHFVNIASMAGLLHAPEMGSYCATKAGVVALSESLMLELIAYGAHVSVVCPAFFQTNLGESLRSPDPKAPARVKKLLASSKLTADDVAAYIAKGVAARRFMILPHAAFRRLWLFKRWFPSLYWAIARKGAKKVLDRL